MIVLTKNLNPLFEFSQIIVRAVLIILVVLLTLSFSYEGIPSYEKLFRCFLNLYGLQFIIEAQYGFMFIQHKIWQNPFSPILGENFILKDIRKGYYFVVRIIVYFEWYFYMLIPVFWFIACIYQFMKTPYNINYTIIGAGSIIIPLCSYIGRKVMKKRYFQNKKAL